MISIYWENEDGVEQFSDFTSDVHPADAAQQVVFEEKQNCLRIVCAMCDGDIVWEPNVEVW